MKNLLISIIAPVYNFRILIECCPRSTLQQQCTDFELMVVDDGSTDSPDLLCKRIADSDNRVVFISQEISAFRWRVMQELTRQKKIG